MVTAAGCKTTRDVVDYFGHRFLRVPMDAATRQQLTEFLTRELGTDQSERSGKLHGRSAAGAAARDHEHPEYQLG